ncbi:aspartate/glutamate racemase family protein [Streptomyces lonarensis]|uniref:Aspartate/glutamate racemase family protein n=1 Tax=Streptomyces lonarensis TaxID=700599 RepID=A0A7X6CZI4_9ACTN|nr:amino acid racemase [Streptomyces lonarensis]NJQ05424.1 aspartate/glutamate racemase family protein [Streptomyces lonarensis]
MPDAPSRFDGSLPVVGILGGMGPAATADFYTKLVAATPGDRDQDHLRTVIWSDPSVPDRTAALLGTGPDPTPWLLRGGLVLRAAGASLIAIPCNTAHAFVPRLAGAVGVPIVHMIGEVAIHLASRRPRVRTAGLLATTGTVHAGLYQNWLGRHGIRTLLPPDDAQQAQVMAAIRAVKAGPSLAVRGGASDALAAAAAGLVARGAQAVVAGCTEIPLGLSADRVGVPLVDPAVVLARALVRHAAGRLPPPPAARGVSAGIPYEP